MRPQKRILEHLRKHGRITQRQISLKFGLWDTGRVMRRLRAEGWEVTPVRPLNKEDARRDGTTYVLDIDQRYSDDD